MTRAERLFYVEHHGNYCGIIAARSIVSARKAARREFGAELNRVRRATAEDVNWCTAMGQQVPNGKHDR